MTKYYSDVTKKFYASEADCIAAEEKELNKQAEQKQLQIQKDAKRKTDAENVENLRKAAVEATKNYKESVEQFVKNYGSYHHTIRSAQDLPSLFDWDFFWPFW